MAAGSPLPLPQLKNLPGPQLLIRSPTIRCGAGYRSSSKLHRRCNHRGCCFASQTAWTTNKQTNKQTNILTNVNKLHGLGSCFVRSMSLVVNGLSELSPIFTDQDYSFCLARATRYFHSLFVRTCFRCCDHAVPRPSGCCFL